MRSFLVASVAVMFLAGCGSNQEAENEKFYKRRTEIMAPWEAEHAVAEADKKKAIELEGARVKRDAGIRLTADDRVVIAEGDRAGLPPMSYEQLHPVESTYERIQREDLTPAWIALQRANYPALHASAVVKAKIAAGIKLKPTEQVAAAAAAQAEADGRARAEEARLAETERNRTL